MKRFTLICTLLLLAGWVLSTRTAAQSTLGKLVYMHDGEVLIKTLPDGETRTLVSGGGAARWSPSGQWLMYDRYGESWVARESGADKWQLKRFGIAWWSPIADVLAVTDGDGSLWVVNADGSGERQLVAPHHDAPRSGVYAIAWSPDGQWLAYTTRKLKQDSPGIQNLYDGIWRIRADGSGATELYNTGEVSGSDFGLVLAGWSPDSKQVWFWPDPYLSASIAADGLSLYSVSMNGGKPQQLTPPILLFPDFFATSSDKQWLAFTMGSGRETWTHKQIVVMNLSSREQHTLTDAQVVAFSPSWSPDSQRIAYVAASDIGFAGGGEAAKAGVARRHIWVMNRDGSGKRQLADDPTYRDEQPLWSADGSHILFARLDRDEHVSLWLIPYQSGTPRKVADDVLIPSGLVPLWFGLHGHIDWYVWYDWWKGTPATTLPASGAAGEQPSLAIGGVLFLMGLGLYLIGMKAKRKDVV